MIKIYTDGANSLNGTPYSYGGYGWVAIWDRAEGMILSGGQSCPPNPDDPVTNNKMELSAIIDALDNMSEIGIVDEQIEVWSDSMWCVQCASKKWARRKNVNLWNKLNQIEFVLKMSGATISYNWIKGHNGDHYNEMVDDIAVEKKMGAKPSKEELEHLKEVVNNRHTLPD